MVTKNKIEQAKHGVSIHVSIERFKFIVDDLLTVKNS